jgi:hypothetical protein
MPEEAERLTPEEIFELARSAGFDPLAAREATAIALVESNGESYVTPDDNGKPAYGIWQIRYPNVEWLIENGSKHDERFTATSPEDLTDPLQNAIAARLISEKLSWNRPEDDPRPYGRWADWPNSYKRMDSFTLWHERDDNTETALEAATRVFHSWTGDDSDALYPEDVGGFGEPGSDASTTDADTLRSQIPDQVPFDDRVRRAMTDKNTPKIMPLQTRMSGQEFSALQRSTQDPGVKAALSKHAEDFRTGNAGFLGYETDEAASTAAGWLRVHGIGVDPQFPFIAYSLGKQAIDKTGDIASQLWDRAIGSLWGGSDGIDRSAYLDSGSDEISDDLNPERR